MTESGRAEGQIQETLVKAVWTMWSQIDHKPQVQMVGTSMSPLINKGDKLFIDPKPKTIRIGDVVIYLHGGKCIAHRVVRIRKSVDKTLLFLKGDNVLNFDPPLPREKIIGRVLGKESTSSIDDYNSRWWLVFNTLMAIYSRSVGRSYLYLLLRRLYRRLKWFR